jgi:hypothetical protein
MADIVEELTIEATPQRVWAALTQPDEIGHWWTNDLNVTSEVGTIAEIRFGEWGILLFGLRSPNWSRTRGCAGLRGQALQKEQKWQLLSKNVLSQQRRGIGEAFRNAAKNMVMTTGEQQDHNDEQYH